jgi:hypothetical protein
MLPRTIVVLPSKQSATIVPDQPQTFCRPLDRRSASGLRHVRRRTQLQFFSRPIPANGLASHHL